MLGPLLEERGLKPGDLAAVLPKSRVSEILVPCPPDSVPFKSAPAGDEAGFTDRRELCLAVAGLRSNVRPPLPIPAGVLLLRGFTPADTASFLVPVCPANTSPGFF